MSDLELDPRWEWIQVRRLGDPFPSPEFVRGACNHLEAVPVEAVTGEVVARLCLTCDSQLP